MCERPTVKDSVRCGAKLGSENFEMNSVGIEH
jgi:hypothetical protein